VRGRGGRQWSVISDQWSDRMPEEGRGSGATLVADLGRPHGSDSFLSRCFPALKALGYFRAAPPGEAAANSSQSCGLWGVRSLLLSGCLRLDAWCSELSG
jgi:hypothetical protein